MTTTDGRGGHDGETGDESSDHGADAVGTVDPDWEPFTDGGRDADAHAPDDDDGSGGVGRRGFLAGTAGAALLAAAPLSLGSGTASAQGDSRGDVDVLNYALTLEHLENEFYKANLDRFSERDFQRSDLLDEFGFGVRFTARDYLRAVQEHEQAHVDFLTTAIDDAGGTPVSAATEYDFAAPLDVDEITTVEEFATVARVLEETGVDAYAGAAPEISNAAFVPPALSIHSVEANHAAYLRTLTGDDPFPDAFNEAKSIDTVLGIVDPIIVQQ